MKAMKQVYYIGIVNINSNGTPINIKMLSNMLRAADIDIAFLQEIRVFPPSLPQGFHGYDNYCPSCDDIDIGTALLLKEGICADDIEYLFQPDIQPLVLEEWA